jgi:hypothetical protein
MPFLIIGEANIVQQTGHLQDGAFVSRPGVRGRSLSWQSVIKLKG